MNEKIVDIYIYANYLEDKQKHEINVLADFEMQVSKGALLFDVP